MEYVLNLKLFYPMLFLTIGVIAVAICSVIKFKNGNLTFKDIFAKHDDNNKDIFFRHSEEHEKTTDKMKDMHHDVVGCLPQQYETELDDIELAVDKNTTKLEKLTNDVEEINNKIDLLVSRIVELEKANKKN